MVDPMALAGMIFTLILVVLIGGIIVITPLTRRLGALLELRLQEKMAGQAGGGNAAELKKLVAELEKEVRALREQHASLEERQQFVESLLRGGEEARPLPAEAARSPEIP